jgi:hypothetical protein
LKAIVPNWIAVALALIARLLKNRLGLLRTKLLQVSPGPSVVSLSLRPPKRKTRKRRPKPKAEL